MKIIRFIASFLIVLGILALMVWAAKKANNKICTGISIQIDSSEKHELLTKSDILNILEYHNVLWEGKAKNEIDLSSIQKYLTQENYIKSVDKVHFLGSKLQIEVTLYDILLEVESNSGQKFLLDVQGTYLPYSPKVGNDVIVASGYIPNTFRKKEQVNPNEIALFELFTIASLITENPYYTALFQKLDIDSNQNITLFPSVGNIPVLFGTTQYAQEKFRSLKYMYDEVLPYVNDNMYAQLDVRFKNRIVATKNKS